MRACVHVCVCVSMCLWVYDVGIVMSLLPAFSNFCLVRPSLPSSAIIYASCPISNIIFDVLYKFPTLMYSHVFASSRQCIYVLYCMCCCGLYVPYCLLCYLYTIYVIYTLWMCSCTRVIIFMCPISLRHMVDMTQGSQS